MVSVSQFAEQFGLSERTVRNYCKAGKLPGAILVGKVWSIPDDAMPPAKGKSKRVSPLLKALREEKESRLRGGIYHRTMIDMTYSSNHIEGSKLTHEMTRMIFETHTLGVEAGQTINVDDILETVNHFRCMDFIIDHAEERLSEPMIRLLHRMLKTGTSDAEKDWFRIGEYKLLANEVGGISTSDPKDVGRDMRELLRDYRSIKEVRVEDIIAFHQRFECIHPFQDGNGRVGRLIMFKECLGHGIVPFIITDELRLFYYRGLREWDNTHGYLLDTCLTAQDFYKNMMDYFRIKY